MTQFGKKCCDRENCPDNQPDFVIEGNWKDNLIDGFAIHKYGGKTQDVIYKNGDCLFDFDDGNTNPKDKIGHIP